MKHLLFRPGLVALAAVLALAGTARAEDKSADLAIIVNKAVGLDNVSSTDLARYLKAEKTKAPDGTKLALCVFDTGHPERDAALKSVYRMSDAEFTDYFVQATFTGDVAAAPKALPSAAAVRQFVASTPGGLGYIRATDADDSVKVVKVDGLAPGDPGYKLKLK